MKKPIFFEKIGFSIVDNITVFGIIISIRMIIITNRGVLDMYNFIHLKGQIIPFPGIILRKVF